jgi:hypothetical protein
MSSSILRECEGSARLHEGNRASVQLVDESSRRCIGKADANGFPARLEREFHNAAPALRPGSSVHRNSI